MATVKSGHFFCSEPKYPMLKFLILLFVFMTLKPASAEESVFNDNLLFAFDKCRNFKLNLSKTLIEEVSAKGFDIHCREANSSKSLFKCDYFDTGSNKSRELEILEGQRDEKKGSLSGKSGTQIHISISKGTASYESVIPSKDGLSDTKKLCVGIFLFEKDALKRKK